MVASARPIAVAGSKLDRWTMAGIVRALAFLSSNRPHEGIRPIHARASCHYAGVPRHRFTGVRATGVRATGVRLAAALAVWSALAGFEHTARAGAQIFVALEYELPPDVSGCPDADEFRANVARQL